MIRRLILTEEQFKALGELLEEGVAVLIDTGMDDAHDQICDDHPDATEEEWKQYDKEQYDKMHHTADIGCDIMTIMKDMVKLSNGNTNEENQEIERIYFKYSDQYPDFSDDGCYAVEAVQSSLEGVADEIFEKEYGHKTPYNGDGEWDNEDDEYNYDCIMGAVEAMLADSIG